MKIIISPAKKMVVNLDDFDILDMPQYLDETKQILAELQQLDKSAAQKLWQTSDKLTIESYQILKQTNLTERLTPAIIAFSGIQYQYMAPGLFTAPALNYVQQNLRILSGFYGILRPFDGITPYRLEMGSRMKLRGYKNLYSFWGSKLYDALVSDQEPIINLASKEYAKAITPYLKSDQQFIDIVFGHLVDGKLKTRATFAKMARGEMVRFAAERNVTDPIQLKEFDHLDYKFDERRSTDMQYIFIKDEK
ncbi:peroxide stress protein YaaA [Lentilactobacillus curieae]|uniref:UPF0246 protein PL11_001545 n=1 Tax=Lentilactobacillus curieae TaxID=1138822 RepID=A0A1S6QGG2_9LACO|nr:peroxide stress protein YaaA [Lentilactobacillus curieae]AQW20690.1 peroxide stress protein YaaA [Lentilactobacillus curieae]